MEPAMEVGLAGLTYSVVLLFGILSPQAAPFIQRTNSHIPGTLNPLVFCPSLDPPGGPLVDGWDLVCLELLGGLPAISSLAHRDILLFPERYLLSLLLLNLLQFALDWVAAFSLSLGKTFCLFAGAGLGGHSAILSLFTDGQSLATFVALPRMVGALWAFWYVASVDGDYRRCGRQLGFQRGSILRRRIFVQNTIPSDQLLCYQWYVRCT